LDDPTQRPPFHPHALPPTPDPYAPAPYATPHAPAPYATPHAPAPYTAPHAPAPYATPYAPAPYGTPYATAPYGGGPYAPHLASANVHVHPAGMVPSLPGMPPVPQGVGPAVSVQISNVVAAPLLPVGIPGPPVAQQAPGVVDLIRADAQQRALHAVARRGPARVLGFGLGAGASLLLLGLMASMFAGLSAAVVAAAAVPVALVAVGGFTVALRAGRGVEGHPLERAILDLAAGNDGVVRVVALARHTGRPLRECQTAVDAMVSAGHATVEADEAGSLVYRVPDLESPRPALAARVAAGPAARVPAADGATERLEDGARRDATARRL
jgi:hypothetical protein